MKCKKILAALMATTFILSTAGCGTKTAEKKKIHIVITSDNTELGKSSETAVNFEPFLKEHPNYELEVTMMGSSDPKLLAMISSGNAPDILRLSAPYDLPTYVSRGLVIPLDDYIKNSKLIKEDDLFEAANIFKFNGTDIGTGSIYGLPKDWSINSCFWINKKLFEEAGVRIPTFEEPFDLEEFQDAVKKLTKFSDNGEVTQMGASLTMTPDEFVEYMLNQTGKSFWKEDFSGTTMEEPDTQKYIKAYYDMQKNGYIKSKINDIDDYSWFSEGKLAMDCTGMWLLSYFNASDNKDLKISRDDIMMVPGIVADKKNPKSSLVTVTGLAISKDCKNKDAAWDVLEYIIAGKLGEDRASMGLNFPALKSMEKFMPQNTEFAQRIIESNKKQAEWLVDKTRVSPYAASSSVAASFTKYYTPALYGEMQLDEALKKIDNDINILTEEGKEIVGVE